MRQPDPDVVEGAEAGRLESQVRRAIESGKATDAIEALQSLQVLANSSSARLVVTTYLLCVVRAAPVVARSGGGDLVALARDIVDIVEPWFARPLDDFSEVAEGGRHAALHALMHVAAAAGRIEDALTIRSLDHAGNLRCVRRWADEKLPGSPGCHAHYPNAYATAQIIGHLVEAKRFGDIPPLLDQLLAITSLAGTVEPETLDACTEEEVGALQSVSGSGGPADLMARCARRLEHISESTQSDDAWPRTRARLTALA